MTRIEHRHLSIIIPLLALVFLSTAFIIPSTVTGSKVCGVCHIGRQAYYGWRNSPHEKVPCLRCHGEPGVGGYLSDQLRAARNLSRLFLGNNTAVTSVANDACTACHTRIVDDLIMKKGVKISHREPIIAGWRCSDCHEGVGHTLASKGKTAEPTYDKCFACHREGGTSDYKCPKCHLGKKPKKPPGPAAGTLDHDRGWASEHGLADLLTCPICHKTDYCRKCHSAPLPHLETDLGSWRDDHGRFAKAATTTCPDCHIESFCDGCHRLPMPHPQPYYPKHAAEATGRRKETCQRCHTKSDCAECHTTHVEHPIIE